ncbi:MAG TPA: GAF domain-containing sensor histidine kinase, partial [Bacillota bacterium]|nr:GAF domain-containing sensor histidine kinase [Bacillota bacterium]
ILDLDELLHKIIDHAMELVGAERGLLMLYPETGARMLQLIVNRNVGREEFQGREFGASRSIISRVEAERKPLLIVDAQVDEDFKTQSSVVLMGIRSALSVPVLAKGALLGVIYLDNRLVSGLFTEEDLQVLDLIANQAGVSIENARYLKEVEKSRQEIALWNRTLEERVIERTRQLEAANRELQAYATVVEELAVAKERNRIARDVHDTLGQTLSVLVTLLESSQDICESNPKQTRKALGEAVKITKGGLNEVRRSISGLVREEGRTPYFMDSLEKLVADFQLSGLKVNLAKDAHMPYLSRTQMETIYRVCQEALTNSLKHGKATEAHIILRFDGKLIKLFIFDNGRGCKEFTQSPGFGLRGMRQRVESLQGRITFGSDGETGFNIHVEIPLEGVGDD